MVCFMQPETSANVQADRPALVFFFFPLSVVLFFFFFFSGNSELLGLPITLLSQQLGQEGCFPVFSPA